MKTWHCSFTFHLILPKENLKVCKYFTNNIISDISNAKQDYANKSAIYESASSLKFFTASLQSIFSITLKPLWSISEPAPVPQLPREVYFSTWSVLCLFFTYSTAQPWRLMSLRKHLCIVHSCTVTVQLLPLLKWRRSSEC